MCEVIDDLHDHVVILSCPICRQQYLSLFSETVDWTAGDDAQRWELTPVTESEAARISGRGSAATEEEIAAIRASKRTLVADHPSGGVLCVTWNADDDVDGSMKARD